MTNAYGDYLSSEKTKVSTENLELIEDSPETWSSGYKIKKFSFMNLEECTVEWTSHNGKVTSLKLPAGIGLEIGYDDPPITSFIIKEEGISYFFVASY
ncbi:hypothetical protein ABE073_03770 [Lederbergia citrisecunda]|uniref:hypothetical protein n=1 Tax=Lederbergia citrisecunda TaxID=2833583 RepID=UPI003D29C922